MTDYADVPQVNSLHQARQSVTYAITLIDSGGLTNSLTIGPPPVPSGIPMAGQPVTVAVPSAPPELMEATRVWLVQRQGELDAELAALGVVNTPPVSAASFEARHQT